MTLVVIKRKSVEMGKEQKKHEEFLFMELDSINYVHNKKKELTFLVTFSMFILNIRNCTVSSLLAIQIRLV